MCINRKALRFFTAFAAIEIATASLLIHGKSITVGNSGRNEKRVSCPSCVSCVVVGACCGDQFNLIFEESDVLVIRTDITTLGWGQTLNMRCQVAYSSSGELSKLEQLAVEALRQDGVVRDVERAECLAVAVATFGAKVTKKRTGLVVGSWDHVPRGCTVQSGGDWAAHYNTRSSPSTAVTPRMYSTVHGASSFIDDAEVTLKSVERLEHCAYTPPTKYELNSITQEWCRFECLLQDDCVVVAWDPSTSVVDGGLIVGECRLYDTPWDQCQDVWEFDTSDGGNVCFTSQGVGVVNSYIGKKPKDSTEAADVVEKYTTLDWITFSKTAGNAFYCHSSTNRYVKVNNSQTKCIDSGPYTEKPKTSIARTGAAVVNSAVVVGFNITGLDGRRVRVQVDESASCTTFVEKPLVPLSFATGANAYTATLPEKCFRGHHLPHGSSVAESYPRPSEAECYLNYCNAYPDLMKAFCSSGTCDTTRHANQCKRHWLRHGSKEGRHDPSICIDAPQPIVLNDVAFSEPPTTLIDDGLGTQIWAWDLGGQDGGVHVAKKTAGEYTETHNYTHAFWIKWRESNVGWRTLLRHDSGHAALVNKGGTELGMYVNLGGGFKGSGYHIEPGRYDLLVVVGNGPSSTTGTGTTTFYIDGAWVGVSNGAVNGRSFNAVGWPDQGPGSIHRIALWDRALSAAEVQAIPKYGGGGQLEMQFATTTRSRTGNCAHTMILESTIKTVSLNVSWFGESRQTIIINEFPGFSISGFGDALELSLNELTFNQIDPPSHGSSISIDEGVPFKWLFSLAQNDCAYARLNDLRVEYESIVTVDFNVQLDPQTTETGCSVELTGPVGLKLSTTSDAFWVHAAFVANFRLVDNDSSDGLNKRVSGRRLSRRLNVGRVVEPARYEFDVRRRYEASHDHNERVSGSVTRYEASHGHNERVSGSVIALVVISVAVFSCAATKLFSTTTPRLRRRCEGGGSSVKCPSIHKQR